MICLKEKWLCSAPKEDSKMKENKFDYDVYNIDEYDYYLPEDLIAQFPAEKRDNSRLLVMNKDEHTLEDKHFYDILNYLKKGDVLVRNNTKVIPARLYIIFKSLFK